MAQKPPKKSLAPIPASESRALSARPALQAAGGILAENTKRAYVADWKDFFAVDSIEKITPDMVVGTTSDQVAAWRDRLLERGLKPGTVNRKLASVRALFDQMILRRIIQVNPAHPKLVRAPKRGGVKKMEYLAPDEIRRLLSMIDRGTPRGRRDYALIMTDLHMGLRQSEALGIRTEQFKTAEGRAYVVFRSKGEKERLITVNRDLAEALSDYSRDRGTSPGWLFPGKDPKEALSTSQFWRIVQKYMTAAGIKKRIGTHGLRATFITINLEKGTPLSEIQKTVGHSRGETTLGYARDLEMIKSRAPSAMEGLKAEDGKA
jgi:integrase/recombinase XerD